MPLKVIGWKRPCGKAEGRPDEGSELAALIRRELRALCDGLSPRVVVLGCAATLPLDCGVDHNRDRSPLIEGWRIRESTTQPLAAVRRAPFVEYEDIAQPSGLLLRAGFGSRHDHVLSDASSD